MHRLALSSCWNAHRFSDGYDLVREILSMGFNWMEISHGAKVTLVPGLLKAHEEGLIGFTSLHAPCPAAVEVEGDAPDRYEFTSANGEERRRAIALTRATLEMAARFGVDRVVVHLGTAKMRPATDDLERMALAGQLHQRRYVKRKLEAVAARQAGSAAAMEAVREALDALLPDCERLGVKLAVETRSHFEQVPTQGELGVLLKEFGNCPWLGSWHDFGHVQRQANLGFLNHEAILREHAPRLLGAHVHDVEWPAEDHLIPFSVRQVGVDFTRLMPLVPEDAPLVWEMRPRQRRLRIAEAREEWMRRFGVGGGTGAA